MKSKMGNKDFVLWSTGSCGLIYTEKILPSQVGRLRDDFMEGVGAVEGTKVKKLKCRSDAPMDKMDHKSIL